MIALIVLGAVDDLAKRAVANIEDVRVVGPSGLNLLDVLKYRHLILTRAAVEALTEQLLKKISRGKAEAADDDEAAETSEPSAQMADVAEAKSAAGVPADVALADAAATDEEPEIPTPLSPAEPSLATEPDSSGT